MSANIHGKMVYSFEKPMWHNITEPSTVPMSATEILEKKFGGGFKVFLRQVTVELNGVPTETGDHAIIRGVSPYDNQEIVFGYCSERYQPLQPADVANSFDVNVLEPAETMAFLGKGEQMFISWKMPSFNVRVGDELDMYGIVRCGFDTLNGASLMTAIVRPVCWNTITLAQHWADANTDGKGRGNIWKGKSVNKNLLRDLGYWMSHVQVNAIRGANLVQNLFQKFAETPIKSDAQAFEILNTAYPDAENVSEYYPTELRPKKEEDTLKFNEKQVATRQGIYRLFAGEGTAITPDFWGMLNSTSEYFCHVYPSKKPIAESVMFGGRQKSITRMVDTLADVLK